MVRLINKKESEKKETIMALFKGAGVAMVTPMKENEDINFEKIEELVEFHINNGTDAIIDVGLY